MNTFQRTKQNIIESKLKIQIEELRDLAREMNQEGFGYDPADIDELQTRVQKLLMKNEKNGHYVSSR